MVAQQDPTQRIDTDIIIRLMPMTAQSQQRMSLTRAEALALPETRLSFPRSMRLYATNVSALFRTSEEFTGGKSDRRWRGKV
jgi:hypothetical protein